MDISIHAPRVGSDWGVHSFNFGLELFQSTLPVWGATPDGSVRLLVVGISIHAPRVGSDAKRPTVMLFPQISIHAPRVGSDDFISLISIAEDISIHAPRVGSDDENVPVVWKAIYFNPRSPCGERLIIFHI